MSYLALARKWRPRQFSDVLGQDPVVRALSHAVGNDSLHPAILLTGTRGVGKTTLARIVAKGLNCETGVRADGCGECDSCVEVDQGRFVDLLEIDAASNTGVDNVRELIDNAQYSPVRGRYKVYLIDEVHMLSRQAFNALLKTLEEPPPHVKFILATTDPQKLPVTVLSRCLQFSLKRLSLTLIKERLAAVLESESVTADDGALTELARGADGSMRDGLSLLDQAIAFAGGEALTRESVESMIGTVGRRDVYRLLDALGRDDRDALREILQSLDSQVPDYASLLDALGSDLQRIAALQLLDNDDPDDDPELRPLADALDSADVQLWYQMSVTGRRDLPWAPDPRAGFEMTVLRMLAFQPERPDDGSRGSRASRSTATPTSSAASEPEPGGAARTPEATALSTPTPAPIPTPPSNWRTVVDALPVDGLVRQLARYSSLLKADDSTWTLALDPAHTHLLNDARKRDLEAAVARLHGAPVVLRFETDEVDDSPAVQEQRERRQQHEEAEQRFTEDAGVKQLIQTFDAEIISGSIRPMTDEMRESA